MFQGGRTSCPAAVAVCNAVIEDELIEGKLKRKTRGPVGLDIVKGPGVISGRVYYLLPCLRGAVRNGAGASTTQPRRYDR